jgi:hypothetical protein
MRQPSSSVRVAIALIGVAALAGCNEFKENLNVIKKASIQNFEDGGRGYLLVLHQSLGKYYTHMQKYPTRWAQLVPSDGRPFVPELFAQRIDQLVDFRPSESSGYMFTYRVKSPDSYELTARPYELGKTGEKSFYVDESGVIRHCAPVFPQQVPNKRDPPVDMPVVQCTQI